MTRPLHSFACADFPLPRQVSGLTLFGVVLCSAVWISLGVARGEENSPAVSTEGLKYFEDQVRPLLTQHCAKCHLDGKAKGGLSLTGRKALLEGGESGPAIDLEKSSESLLLKAVNYDGMEMPPSGKLSAESIAILTKWVEMGLPMPDGEVTAAPKHGPPQVNETTKSHWSFRRLQKPVVPQVSDPSWIENPIDAFVLHQLESKGLKPNPAAMPRELYRRVHYDLVGLPPAVSEVARFEAAPTDEAYSEFVESLLESPQHGEHWARYWLDLVRYAETNSYERDDPKPFAWRYRDYVIRSLNQNKPYDQFLKEQLAGDELDEVTPDSLIATGYYRLGLWDDEPVDREMAFFDGLDDVVGTTAQTFLGLTMNCARCHDHKLDPLPQADYYRFLAFFRNLKHYGVRAADTVVRNSIRDVSPPEQLAAHAKELEAHQQKIAGLNQEIVAFEEKMKPFLKGGEIDDFKAESTREDILRKHIGEALTKEDLEGYSRLRREHRQLRENPPRSQGLALVVKENGKDAPPTHVLIRGNAHAEGDAVEPGFPSVLTDTLPVVHVPASGESTGRRRALAEWMVSPENPLTARVIANRVWQWHFGRGIVKSANNFGLQGDAPTHPELLDWLATELIEHHWDLRHLHRLILHSSTYRMSSRGQAAAFAIDPLNDQLWRFDMRRLRAEEIRDTILATNGTLNLETMFGPSVYPKIEKEVLAGQSIPGSGWEQNSPDGQTRRSIYVHIKRSLTVPLLAAFDVADSDSVCPVRFATTQPTQALSMLNSVFLNDAAATCAKLVHDEAGDDSAQCVTVMLKRTLQREPTPKEIERGTKLIADLREKHQLSAEKALQYYCLMAMNLSEFVYLD